MEAPQLGAVRRALDAILRQQQPFPAVVMNRCWDILQTNDAATRFFGFLLGDRASSAPPNVLRLMFHPEAARPFEGLQLDFFSTVTTLGTPQDVTLQEIRIECFFPADEATDRAARELLTVVS